MKSKLIVLMTLVLTCKILYGNPLEINDTAKEGAGRKVHTMEDVAGGGTTMEFTECDHRTIFLTGLGAGYYDTPGYRTFTSIFFLAHLREFCDYAAIRAAGEVYTDFRNALSFDISAGINVYPFQYGTTPYLGIEAGYGYGQVEGESDYGFNISAEVGVFAIKLSDALLAASVRFSLMQSMLSGEYPSGFSVRFGFLF